MSTDQHPVPDQETKGPARGPGEAGLHEILPYVAPMFAFLALTSLEGYVPGGPVGYPVAYAIKVAIVAAVAWFYRSAWSDLRPVPSRASLPSRSSQASSSSRSGSDWRGSIPALGFLGKRTAFDPAILEPGWKWAFVTVRFFGLVLLVPLIEELFWRSFLIRWLAIRT